MLLIDETKLSPQTAEMIEKDLGEGIDNFKIDKMSEEALLFNSCMKNKNFKRAYNYITRYCWATGKIPKNIQVAKNIGCSQNTVTKIKNEMKKCGVLKEGNENLISKNEICLNSAQKELLNYIKSISGVGEYYIYIVNDENGRVTYVGGVKKKDYLKRVESNMVLFKFGGELIKENDFNIVTSASSDNMPFIINLLNVLLNPTYVDTAYLDREDVTMEELCNDDIFLINDTIKVEIDE